MPYPSGLPIPPSLGMVRKNSVGDPRTPLMVSKMAGMNPSSARRSQGVPREGVGPCASKRGCGGGSGGGGSGGGGAAGNSSAPQFKQKRSALEVTSAPHFGH